MRRVKLLCLMGVIALLASGCDKRKWRDRDESLHDAAAWGTVERVQTLLARGTNVNARNKDGNTALHEAARRGRFAVAQLLIGRGANVNLRNNQGQTPVMLAMEGDSPRQLGARGNCRTLVELLAAVGAEPTFRLAAYLGDAEMARRLVAGAADINAEEGGRTPLHWATSCGRREIVELLLAAGAKVDAQGASGSTPLHAAVSQASAELVQLLLARGADVNARDRLDETPLHVAVRAGGMAMVKALLAAGADVNGGTTRSGGPANPLAIALKEGRADVAEILVHAGADVNAKDRFGWTPLHAAIAAMYEPDVYRILRQEHTDANLSDRDRREKLERGIREKLALRWAGLLIDHHADVNAQDAWGITPLHCAAYLGSRDTAEFLLSKGADVNARTTVERTSRESTGGEPLWVFDMGRRMTPLHEAVGSGEPNVVELLLAHGADVNATDDSGRTPLHYAAQQAGVKTVELLIARGAAVDARDDQGRTALLDAVQGWRAAVANALLAAGAEKVVVKNRPGQTMLHDAWRRRADRALLAVLLVSGADPDERDAGETLLHVLAREGEEETARVLLAGGADVNARNYGGVTPLHYAAGAGHVGLASMLLARGADVRACAHDGDTPLHNAALRGNREMVELLLAHGADTSLKNSRGRTPLDEAVRRGHKDVMELLTAKARDSAATTPDGQAN